jgi:dihydroneopterin aldolase
MDAWGRTGKQQPALVSVEVRMREPFGESSEKDEVAGDTVHYGLLAKGIMAKIQETEEQECLMGYMITLWRKLVGYVDLSCVMQFLGDAGEALLKKEQVAYVRVSIKMTKASLLGEGVSMDWAAAFLEDTTARGMEAAASSMKVHGLRIPTLVGVNANERTAKQIVLANVWVEKLLGVSEDFHPDFEAVVTQVCFLSHFRFRSIASC